MRHDANNEATTIRVRSFTVTGIIHSFIHSSSCSRRSETTVIMEVLAKKDKSASPFLLSNAEVLDMLRPRVQDRKDKETRRYNNPSNTKYRHRDLIEDSVVEFLENTPCVSLDSSKRKNLQNLLMTTNRKASGKNKKSATTGFGLTDAESLQILNYMPQEKVEIHLMVEELHTRMTDERQDELLTLIQSHVVHKEDANEQENNNFTEDVVMEEEAQEPKMCAVKEEI
jgi:hypothetical protein